MDGIYEEYLDAATEEVMTALGGVELDDETIMRLSKMVLEVYCHGLVKGNDGAIRCA